MSKKLKWDKEKEEELIKMWNNTALSKIATYFHCTQKTIKEKAEELNLESYNSGRWTKEEENLLKEYSSKFLTNEIAEKLNRSYVAVQKKAIKLGICLHSEEDPWEEWMITYLKENINKIPIGKVCDKLNLSYRRVLTKCSELGIDYVKTDWTEEEIEILKTYANKCHYTELVKVLPNRSVGAISAKAYELGIKTISDYYKLNDEDAEYIKKNWGKIPATEIARNLKVSMGIIERYKKQLNLPNVGQQKKWTTEVISKLKEDANQMSRQELAKKYHTSVEQISMIASKNDIKLQNSKIRWNKNLDDELLKLVDEGLSIVEISNKMQIKATTIRTHLKTLDSLRYEKVKQVPKTWSKEEKESLKQLSKISTVAEMAIKLNKTEKQVYDMCNRLGLKVDSGKKYYWNEKEIQTLINLSGAYDRHLIAKVMDRSEESIKEKARELNLKLRIRQRKLWTVDEEILLTKYAKEFCVKEIANLLNRSVASVDSKLKYMGIAAQINSKFWTDKELETLKELAKEYSIEEIAKMMGKSYHSIYAKIYQLGINIVNKPNKPWNKEDDLMLLELLTTYSSFEVAEILNRSEESVIVRAIKLGYEIGTKNRSWTKEEEMLLSNLWGSESIDDIAKKLNRTPSAIKNRVYVLGLGSQIENNYEGLRIGEIADIFKVHRNTILTYWVSLGLKLDFKKVSEQSGYAYVTIENLYEFLENFQDFWDSKTLEENIFGAEPLWLQEKRIKDRTEDISDFKIENLSKYQLIQAKNYYLNLEEETNLEKPKQKTNRK